MGKEFAILIAVHVSTAEINCPYRIEEGRLLDILKQHELSLRDVFTATRSPDLQAEIDKVNAAFRSDKLRACETAWKNFGPGGPFGGLLQRR
ncbi:MAG TPA: hypothetical protein VF601_20810 [Beijerinckiaceae bacterium]|jgi:hypothetical protein